MDVGGAAIAGRSLGDAAALRARQPWRPGAPLTGDGSVGGERLEGPPREIRALPSTRWIAGGLSRPGYAPQHGCCSLAGRWPPPPPFACRPVRIIPSTRRTALNAREAVSASTQVTGQRGAAWSASKPDPRPLRTLAVFHLAEASGPAYSLRPRLEAVAAQGGSLEVLAPGEGSLARLYGDLGPVRALAYETLTVPRTPREAARGLTRFVRDVRLFRGELRRAQPDLVVLVTTLLPAAVLAARLEHLPTIVYVGEIFDKGHVGGGLRALGGNTVARLSEALTDRLVCCSRTVANQFHRPGRAVAIYPGISPSYADGDGASFRARHGLGDAGPVVAVVGNLSPGRGQDSAVRALAHVLERLPSARLLIAGLPHPRAVDEAFAAEVRRLARELGVERSVVFTGAVERVADLYAASDLVVNPARFNEPFGRVAPEALMAGRAVVASAVGAIPEVLRDGRDALLVPPDDPRALGEAIVRLVEDAGLRDRLVAEGRRRVQTEFAEEAGVEAFERVVAEVLAERAGSPSPDHSRAPARRPRD